MTVESFLASQKEVFTQRPWNELYEEAIQVVPFYLVGRIQVHPDSQEPSGADNPREHTYEWYDGTSLKLHLEDESISPLTRHKILDVKYFCLKLPVRADIKGLNQKEILSHLVPITSLKFKESDPSNVKFLFDSLNPYAGNKNPLVIGKIQFIVASKLQNSDYQRLWREISQANMIKSTLSR